jgi:hypothetical protein
MNMPGNMFAKEAKEAEEPARLLWRMMRGLAERHEAALPQLYVR